MKPPTNHPKNSFTSVKKLLVYYLCIVGCLTIIFNISFFISRKRQRKLKGLILRNPNLPSFLVGAPEENHRHELTEEEQQLRREKHLAYLEEKKRLREEKHAKWLAEKLANKTLAEQRKIEERKQKEITLVPPHYGKKNRGFVKDILIEAGYNLSQIDKTVLKNLPRGNTIQEILGNEPKIIGLDTCTMYQQRIPGVDRIIGSAGLFSTGTNLIIHLLKKNCYIPEKVDKYGVDITGEDMGIRFQVPWGKNSPAKYKWSHVTVRAGKAGIIPSFVFPVVTIRNPYHWMKGICDNSFSIRWPHVDRCPHLKKRVNTTAWHVEQKQNHGVPDDKHVFSIGQDGDLLHHNTKDNTTRSLQQQQKDNNNAGAQDEETENEDNHNTPLQYEYEWNPVTIKYSDTVETHESVAHLWNDWYHGYRSVTYPRLMIRYEDLVFFQKQTTKLVCECFGGKIGDPKELKELEKEERKKKRKLRAAMKKNATTTTAVNITDTTNTTYTYKFRYHADAANPQIHPDADLLAAIREQGKKMPPSNGFSKAEYLAAVEALDKTLMNDFGYVHPPAVTDKMEHLPPKIDDQSEDENDTKNITSHPQK